MFADVLGLYYRVNIKSSLIGVRAKNFNCLFNNLEIVQSICTEISKEDRSKILNQVSASIDFWYKKYQKDNVFLLRYFSLNKLKKDLKVVFQDKKETKMRIRRLKRMIWAIAIASNVISVSLTYFLVR